MSTPSTPSSPTVGSAAQALTQAGLTLPQGADKVTFTESADTAYVEHYRVGFTLPAAAAKAFCSTGGLGGDLPAAGLTAAEQKELGPAAKAVAGSRVCGSLAPDAMEWNRTVLVGPGDPATVWVSVGRMGR